MVNFNAAADTLDLALYEVLEVLGLTEAQAEKETLSVEEILDACYDNGLGDDDWEGDSFAGTYGY
jgi:hypothetical protein